MVLGGTAVVGAIVAAPAVAVATGVGATATATGAGAVAVATGAGATATAASTLGAVAVSAAELSASLAAPLISSGPIGWVVLGADREENGDLSWDCWKPVIRESSTLPSRGRLLKEIINDERIKHVYVSSENILHIKNIWDEKFRIDFAFVENQLAAHATRL